jgi:hypothetical protein
MPESAEYFNDLQDEANADCYSEEGSEEDIINTETIPKIPLEKISYYTNRNNYLHIEYTGDPFETVTTVMKRINNQDFDQCYEFMRARIVEVKTLEDGRLFIKTKQSMNAGD